MARKTQKIATTRLDQIKLGERLRKARLDTGLTQARVATMCEMSRSYLSDLENGRALPGLQNLATLGLLYMVPLEYIVHGTGPHRPLATSLQRFVEPYRGGHSNTQVVEDD